MSHKSTAFVVSLAPFFRFVRNVIYAKCDVAKGANRSVECDVIAGDEFQPVKPQTVTVTLAGASTWPEVLEAGLERIASGVSDPMIRNIAGGMRVVRS